jgi:hypothetical protein
MAEQTFRSPGFFEQEVDLSARSAVATGTPGGIVGTAEKGPAFVPVTVGNLIDFENKFGSLSIDRFGPYAVREFLKSKNALTYVRVLGAGSNETAAQRLETQLGGFTKNAGFKLESNSVDTEESSGVGINSVDLGAVQFIVARHAVNTLESAGYPIFSDNESYDLSGGDNVNLVRAVLFTTTGSHFEIMDFDETFSVFRNSRHSFGRIDANSNFRLVLSSTAGTDFSNDEGWPGVKIFTASLDPANTSYLGRVLNTDPDRFQEEQHLLYLDYPVESELVSILPNAAGAVCTGFVGVVSGTAATTNSGYLTSEAFGKLFGRFDSRFTTPRTPSFISQPYGSVEYDLFNFETISDGEWGNTQFKISIANIRKSNDPLNLFGSFDVQLRNFNDSDLMPEILEYYPDCNLNPSSPNYIARKIGDKKVTYNFDAVDESERRLVISGKYPNISTRIRIVMNDNVETRNVPGDALPFGFRGVPAVKTNNALTDNTTSIYDRNGRLLSTSGSLRMSAYVVNDDDEDLDGLFVERAIVPPLPLRFKCTRGAVNENPSYTGHVGRNERADARFYWGVKFEKLPSTSSLSNAVLNANVSSEINPLVKSYTKFQGIEKLDTLVTGSAKDYFNSNKFTLARVALYNELNSGHITDVTGTARDHMLEAAYIRNEHPNGTNYTVADGARNRITMATLVHSTSTVFNRFQEFNKFTTIFYGGFDGLNMLDKDNRYMADKAASADAGGKAGSSFTGGLGLFGTDDGTMSGIGIKNNIVSSYRAAVDIITDPMASNINILAIPGMRDSFISDYAAAKTQDFGLAIYLMDIPNYDADGNRLFNDSVARVDARETSEQFESRVIDNNYVATYFPDVYVREPVSQSNIKVPPSVPAMGALAYNDRVSYPWFAPAGFNRGALDAVTNVDIRLNTADRDVLYDARINPIATFPAGGFVIFGQKTLQMAKSALDRVNVRRLLIEVKRIVASQANRLLFEQNNAATRARFVSQVSPLLTLVQAQAGIEQFKIVCDTTNNTQSDVDSNRMNGRIIIVPTRAIEFISIDFVITNSGVIFE